MSGFSNRCKEKTIWNCRSGLGFHLSCIACLWYCFRCGHRGAAVKISDVRGPHFFLTSEWLRFVLQMARKEFGVCSFGQHDWKTRDMRSFVASPTSSGTGEGRKECPPYPAPPPPSPPLQSHPSMHVPQHFTGIWALGKLRRPRKILNHFGITHRLWLLPGFQELFKRSDRVAPLKSWETSGDKVLYGEANKAH